MQLLHKVLLQDVLDTGHDTFVILKNGIKRNGIKNNKVKGECAKSWNGTVCLKDSENKKKTENSQRNRCAARGKKNEM